MAVNPKGVGVEDNDSHTLEPNQAAILLTDSIEAVTKDLPLSRGQADAVENFTRDVLKVQFTELGAAAVAPENLVRQVTNAVRIAGFYAHRFRDLGLVDHADSLDTAIKEVGELLRAQLGSAHVLGVGVAGARGVTAASVSASASVSMFSKANATAAASASLGAMHVPVKDASKADAATKDALSEGSSRVSNLTTRPRFFNSRFNGSLAARAEKAASQPETAGPELSSLNSKKK